MVSFSKTKSDNVDDKLVDKYITCSGPKRSAVPAKVRAQACYVHQLYIGL